jgi:hypothetical protein
VELASEPPRSTSAKANALLDTVAARIQQALSALPDAADLQRCAPFMTPACRAQLSAALYEALDGSVVPAIEQREIDLEQLDPSDSAAALDAIMARLERSTDPRERVAALVLLERASQLKAGPLPSGAFRGLGERTVIEAQLLLTYGEYATLPDEDAVREVAALAAAQGGDTRAQGAALNALAHRHAPELISVVRALQAAHVPEWTGWSEVVAPALARCGMACAHESVQVVAAAPDPARLAAQILRRCPPPEHAELLARLAPALPEHAQSQGEQAEL